MSSPAPARCRRTSSSSGSGWSRTASWRRRPAWSSASAARSASTGASGRAPTVCTRRATARTPSTPSRGRRTYIALGTIANRTARVAGINLGGGYATFPGVVGTAVTKVCDFEVGRTGLTERQATAAGFEPVDGHHRLDRAGRLLPRRRTDDGQAGRRAPHGAPSRRADRRWSGGGQAHRRAGHRPLRPPHRGRPRGRRSVLRAAVLAGLGSGARPAARKALSQI